MIVVGPVTWLGFGMIGGVGSLVTGLDTGQLAIPLPPESVKGWPLVGERLHRAMESRRYQYEGCAGRDGTNVKPIGGKLLGIAQGAFLACWSSLSRS